MPRLNVARVLLDPDFCEALTIYRRQQTIDSHGRVVSVSTLVSPAPYGVILPSEDASLARQPDQQNLPRTFEVHTSYRLRSASDKMDGSEHYMPDLIVWQGLHLQVFRVMDFSRFGRGFICAYAVSVDPIDVEPQP